ncbi:MAG TPA: hypothetical protein G4O13_00245 [Dehalococcoidia bacterium]|nr:hypothetical protein [Dehalococcoidia bacterium]
MRPKFWYCDFCGYMFLDEGGRGPVEKLADGAYGRNCLMCGEDAWPCWERISSGMFDETWCKNCENKAECWAKFKVYRRAD